MKNKFLFISFRHQYDNFLNFHINSLQKNGCNVEFVILDDLKNFNIHRRSLKNIFNELLYILKIINDFNPKTIVTITPKIGFLVTLARLVFFKWKIKTIHWFTGQVWANKFGFSFYAPKLADLFTFYFSSLILCDSNSQKLFLRKQGFYFKDINVLGRGSVCGINENIFNITRKKGNNNKFRIGIVGRISVDKGSFWLLNFVKNNLKQLYNIEFIFFGSFDEEVELINLFSDNVKILNENIKIIGQINDPVNIYSHFDCLLQPSFREGFSNVIIEAQGASIPVISRNIYGTKSSLIENLTGFFFNSDEELLNMILLLKNNSKLYDYLSLNAKNFVAENFKRTHVIDIITNFYLNKTK